MEHIYIPLALVPEGTDDDAKEVPRTNPLDLLRPNSRNVILGDPGCGKSTLLRFLALIGQTKSLQQRFGGKPNVDRLPVYVTLRRYADELKQRPNLSIIDYIVEVTNGDFSLKGADLEFFEFYLESGQALLCFDGLDELPNPQFKSTVRDRITSFVTTYPGNTCVVTSRIVGYDGEVRFDNQAFHHMKVGRLRIPEIEQFVSDWYTVREKSKKIRDDNVRHLTNILRDEDNQAIRELARNPLLLTIIALVHRIDAVLPDERVVLYQKCTETLLNTWHTWKYRDIGDQASRNKVERRNRLRMEAIAHWMQQRSVNSGMNQRSVVPREELYVFLAEFIQANEKPSDTSRDPEEAAEAFLDFVKGRAGLLVEVGDRQYSFVHLTFQEYLTSAHILTISEKGGAESLWQNISPQTDSDRWQEAIRLLIASLKSSDTKEFLIDRMVQQCEASCEPNRAHLLLGCLMDAGEDVEEYAGRILRLALISIMRTRQRDDVRRLVGRFRVAQRKLNIAATSVTGEMRSILQSVEPGSDDYRALVLASHGIQQPITLPVAGATAQTPSDRWLQMLLIDGRGGLFDEGCASSLRLLQSASAYLLLRSPQGNMIACCSLAIPAEIGEKASYRYALRLLLTALRSGVDGGPYFHCGFNLCTLFAIDFVDSLGLLERIRRMGGLHAIGDRPQHQHVKEEPRDAVLSKAFQAGRVFQGFEVGLRSITANRGLPSHRRAVAAMLQNEEPRGEVPYDAGLHEALTGDHSAAWIVLTSSSTLTDFFFQLLTTSLDLSPPSHWPIALESKLPHLSPQIALRLHEQTSELRTEADMSANCDLVALALSLDAWFWLAGVVERPNESPFRSLARRARRSETAILRLAGLLRDLAYGDEKCIPEFVALITKPNAEVKRLLMESYWINK